MMKRAVAKASSRMSPVGARLGAILVIILVLLAVGVSAIRLRAAGGPTFKRGTVVLSQDGRSVVLKVDIANTPETRSHGLMFRKSLHDDEGMLFIFENEERWAFWMKNTLVPLSIAFVDRTWRVVDIQDMPVAPSPEHGPFPVYQSKAPARYALEVAQGLFIRKRIGVGARVQFTLHE